MTSARFEEIKVENELTWFLICFSKKKHMDLRVFSMLFCIKNNLNLEKRLRVNFEQS